jgi:hypothetical protein
MPSDEGRMWKARADRSLQPAVSCAPRSTTGAGRSVFLILLRLLVRTCLFMRSLLLLLDLRARTNLTTRGHEPVRQVALQRTRFFSTLTRGIAICDRVRRGNHAEAQTKKNHRRYKYALRCHAAPPVSCLSARSQRVPARCCT